MIIVRENLLITKVGMVGRGVDVSWLECEELATHVEGVRFGGFIETYTRRH